MTYYFRIFLIYRAKHYFRAMIPHIITMILDAYRALRNTIPKHGYHFYALLPFHHWRHYLYLRRQAPPMMMIAPRPQAPNNIFHAAAKEGAS